MWQARPFFRLEGARTLRLLDVLANAGWLQTANPAPSPAVTPGDDRLLQQTSATHAVFSPQVCTLAVGQLATINRR